MNIVYKKIKEIQPYKGNPRDNNDAVEFVANSIKEFGFQVPIVIDKNNIIVAGHTRYKASKKLKLKEVPCIIADNLTDEQIKAYRLADNKTGEISTWNIDLLNLELNDIGIDFNMTDFGFLDLAIEELSAVDDDYDVVLPDVPKSKLGDIYKLGKHRLMCGDSTHIGDVEKLMHDTKAKLFITDPPYNVDYTGKTKDALTIENDKMPDDNFREFLRAAFSCANEVMECGAVYYIWHADSEGYNFRGACKDVGFKVRQCLIWLKNSIVMGRQDYHWQHEPCLYGWKDGSAHLWTSNRKQATILKFDKPQKNAEHPTMKPVELFAYQISNNTNVDDIVLDLFGGSGTSLIASEQLNRICYMMELDPKYIDVIIDRWEKLTGLKAELCE